MACNRSWRWSFPVRFLFLYWLLWVLFSLSLQCDLSVLPPAILLSITGVLSPQSAKKKGPIQDYGIDFSYVWQWNRNQRPSFESDCCLRSYCSCVSGPNIPDWEAFCLRINLNQMHFYVKWMLWGLFYYQIWFFLNFFFYFKCENAFTFIYIPMSILIRFYKQIYMYKYIFYM